MKRIIILLFVLFWGMAGAASAQIETPVRWSYAAKKLNATQGVLFIKATIDEGWHIYSQTIQPGGPVKTSFFFNPSPDYSLSGTTMEPEPKSEFEETFTMTVKYFERSVIFQQKINLKKGTFTVKGKLKYMVCNDEKCLPPDELPFSIPIK